MTFGSEVTIEGEQAHGRNGAVAIDSARAARSRSLGAASAVERTPQLLAQRKRVEKLKALETVKEVTAHAAITNR
jgi:hypothetical protein